MTGETLHTIRRSRWLKQRIRASRQARFVDQENRIQPDFRLDAGELIESPLGRLFPGGASGLFESGDRQNRVQPIAVQDGFQAL